MARTAERPEFWAMVLEEARRGEQSLERVAQKHGVKAAALKYRYYRSPRRDKAPGDTARVLPVRLRTEPAKSRVEATVGQVRLSFECCEPTYIAAVLSALGRC